MNRVCGKWIVRRLSGVVAAGCLACPALAQRVVAFGDEWVLSNQAFSVAPAPTIQLATQLSAFVTNGQSGASLLFWTQNQQINPTVSQAQAGGSQFRSFLVSQGHTVQHTQNFGLTLAHLQQFHTVFVQWPFLDAGTASMMTQYVNGGGSVVVFGGTTASQGEAIQLNHFLNNFNIHFNLITGPAQTIQVPVAPNSDPVGSGLPSITWGYGHAVSLINYLDPNSSLVEGLFDSPLGPEWAGVLATYNGVPAPGAAAVLAVGGLLAARRRRA